MEKINSDEQKFILAKKRVEKLRKFYKHLATYIIVNTFLSALFIFNDVNDGDTLKEALLNYHNYKIWLYWGIGIAFQTINVFGERLFFSKDWEERKLNKYLNQK